jgi:hypothetical protein
MKLAPRTLAASVLLALAGCASIMGTPNQQVPIQSTPSDASVVITDEKGIIVFKGTTPTSVTLQKSTGRYWGGKDYVVTIAKDGYGAQTIPVRSSPNGWYIAGNFVFGSIIGWFVVDPWSGNMWSLSPDVVSPSLATDAAASPAAHNNSSPDRIRIMLLEDVPQDLRAKMTPINPAKS